MIDSDDICSVLAPIAITASMITSATAGGAALPEDPNPAWSSTGTYTSNQVAYVASTHRIYQSAKDGNLGNDPTLPANQFDAAGTVTWWIDAGPTNLFAMFDSLVSSQSTGASPFTITLTPGYLNGFALFGLDADDLTVTVKDAPGGNLLYSYDAPLEGSAPSDYYEYFFDRFKPQTQFIASGIDPYNNAEITLTLTKGSGLAKIGMFAIGDMRPIGAPLRGASVEPVDYSSITTDVFGNTTVIKRNNATGLVISCKMDIEDADSVLDTVKELLGVPVVVVGSSATMYEALTVFGLMSARQQYDDYGEPTINITVKGTI